MAERRKNESKWRGPRLRLLPIAIGVLVLSGGVRVSTLIQDLQAGRIAAPVIAQAEAAAEADPASEATEENKTPAAEETAPEAYPAPATPRNRLPPTEDFSETELEILQSLAERREELDGRAQALAQREALLAAAEARLDEKFSELDTLRAELEDLLKLQSEKQEAQLMELVRIYEKMKPRDAAQIFNAMPMDTLLDVMERMKSIRSAPVLAAMQPDRARAVTVELANRRAFPEDVAIP